MKIEKLNDNQIRCTLTRADLASRELKLSELICGSEKAKSLFKEMMEQAASEFGFEAEDMPLMIEAVPASSDSIVLIVTKVDDPEELDSKFSKFGTSFSDLDPKKRSMLDKLEGAEDILDLIHKVKEAVSDSGKQFAKNQELYQDSTDIDDSKNDHTESDIPEQSRQAHPKQKQNKQEHNKQEQSKIRLFSFATIDSVIHACHVLKSLYHGANTLYKDTSNNLYILAMTQSDLTSNDFNKVCNMMSEYGSTEKATSAVLAFLEEHCEVIVAADAVTQLGNL